MKKPWFSFQRVSLPQFDERDQHIQLLVTRDCFITLLLMLLIMMLALPFLLPLSIEKIMLLLFPMIVIVGVVARLSHYWRNGSPIPWRRQRALAKGQLLCAPLEAAVLAFLFANLSGTYLSLLYYLGILLALLIYPVLFLLIARSKLKQYVRVE